MMDIRKIPNLKMTKPKCQIKPFGFFIFVKLLMA